MARRPRKRRSPARWLAPLALLAAAFAVYTVAGLGGDGGGSTSGTTSTSTTRTSSKAGTGKARKRKAKSRTYTVKAGDTLGAISEKTGVSLTRIQELNPKLDSQALQTGEKIKLGP